MVVIQLVELQINTFLSLSLHGGIVIYTEILVVRLHITFLHVTAR